MWNRCACFWGCSRALSPSLRQYPSAADRDEGRCAEATPRIRRTWTRLSPPIRRTQAANAVRAWRMSRKTRPDGEAIADEQQGEARNQAILSVARQLRAPAEPAAITWSELPTTTAADGEHRTTHPLGVQPKLGVAAVEVSILTVLHAPAHIWPRSTDTGGSDPGACARARGRRPPPSGGGRRLQAGGGNPPALTSNLRYAVRRRQPLEAVRGTLCMPHGCDCARLPRSDAACLPLSSRSGDARGLVRPLGRRARLEGAARGRRCSQAPLSDAARTHACDDSDLTVPRWS